MLGYENKLNVSLLHFMYISLRSTTFVEENWIFYYIDIELKLYWICGYYYVLHTESQIRFLTYVTVAILHFVLSFPPFHNSSFLFFHIGTLLSPLLFIVTFVEEFIEYLIGKCSVYFHTKKKERKKDFSHFPRIPTDQNYMILCPCKGVIAWAI